jgi:hypothetical protein
MATKYTIEMATPDDLDPSALLERMQEVAVELAEADWGELSKRTTEVIRNEVSVTLLTSKAERALGAAEGKADFASSSSTEVASTFTSTTTPGPSHCIEREIASLSYYDLARSMRIHGFPVVGFINLLVARDGKQGRIVIVDRGKDYPDRWVTGLHFIGDDEWSNGHYFVDLDEAKADLVERARGR